MTLYHCHTRQASRDLATSTSVIMICGVTTNFKFPLVAFATQGLERTTHDFVASNWVTGGQVLKFCSSNVMVLHKTGSFSRWIMWRNWKNCSFNTGPLCRRWQTAVLHIRRATLVKNCGSVLQIQVPWENHACYGIMANLCYGPNLWTSSVTTLKINCTLSPI